MKNQGQPFALLIAATLLWSLAVAHPAVWWFERMAVSEAPAPLNAGFRYVSTFTDSESLREELREEAVIGYASEGEFDIRAGGSGLAGYYLAQFAVAPVLLDPHSASREDADKYDLVLATFETPGQLSAYLIEHSRQALVSLSGNIALTHRRKR